MPRSWVGGAEFSLARGSLFELPMLHEVDFASELGLRLTNEDSLLADPSAGIYAVADGVGGEEGGEIASRTVIDSLQGFWRRCETPEQRDALVAADQIDLAVRLAHRRVADAASGPYAKMGTTLATLVACGSQAVIAHVGDSRIYRLRGERLERLTVDHSVREVLKVEPDLEIPYLDALVRAIAPHADARPDVQTLELERGDVILLCTDGVYKPLGDAHIGRLLAGPWSGPARVLVAAALAAGGRDNATAIVLSVY